jgi:hypothetical protein
MEIFDRLKSCRRELEDGDFGMPLSTLEEDLELVKTFRDIMPP